MSRKKGETKRRAKASEPGTPDAQKAAWEMFDKLRLQANQGDRKAPVGLLEFLRCNSWLWGRLGNAAAYAQRSVMETMTGGEWLAGECIRHEAEQLRKGLLGPTSSALEQMAADRIVVAWLQLEHAQTRCAEPQKDVGWARFWLRRLEVANDMFDSAVKTLALIRQFLPAQAEPRGIGMEIAEAGLVRNAERTVGQPINRVAGLFDTSGDEHHPAKRNGVNRVQEVLKKVGRNGTTVSVP